MSDDERLDDLLEIMLVDAGITPAYIPKADWTAEVDEWLTGVRVNTIWIENLESDDALKKILTYFMLDMWFDPVLQEVKLSANNVWKETNIVVTEAL